jgi:transposase
MNSATDFNTKTKDELIEILHQKDKHILFLEELHRAYQLRQFGNQSEKITPDQYSLFDEAIQPKNTEKLLQAEEEIQVASYTKKPGRKALPPELPRIQRIYDLEESEKICACGCALTHIKDEKSEQLEIIPARIYVIEHTRRKYACRACEETIKTAPMPKAPIPRSIAASGLLSHVIVSKFNDHLPLYRQEKILKRMGIDIPRATLCLWVIKCAELLKPFMQIKHEHILNYDIAYADETTLQVLKDPNKGVGSKKYMWLFAGGPPDKFVFYYRYHHSRAHDVALNFFEKFKGYLHCDGYPAYDTIAAKNNTITLSGCLYHARRKFVEVIKLMNGREGVATTVVAYIAQLARIEESIKYLSAGEKHLVRQEKSKPLFDEMHNYLLKSQSEVPPKSLLGKAISYTLNQWTKLVVHLNDGRLDNSNNLSERAIKPFVMGRKGWLFADSVVGAQAAAILFSLVETCKHHKVEPYDWFRYVLQKMSSCQTTEEINTLLPFNIDKNLLVSSAN